jgi:hypothetical protein
MTDTEKAIKAISSDAWESAFEKRFGAPLSEAEIYRRALERIVRCNEKSCERYVAKVDAIACEALALGDSILVQDVHEGVVENHEVARPIRRAA